MPPGHHCQLIWLGFILETRIDIAGASALRRIAGNIREAALLPAFRADIWRLCRGYGETAMGTFPIRQAALRTDISLEPTIGRVSAACTHPFRLFVLHAISPFQLMREII
jgi:hypothetical protein